MTQTWDAQAYEKNGAFVHGLAGGVLEWLAAQPGERILDLGCGDGQLTAAHCRQRRGRGGRGRLAARWLAAARSRGIDAHEGCAESLPFADRSASMPCFPTPLCTGCAIRTR